MHLWEVDHPYYCNEGNYFSNDCSAHYKSWPEFASSEGGSDLDMNLVFRWDWKEGVEDGAGDFNGDVNYRNGRFLVFFMGQRKGLYRYAEIEVCRADEPAILEFLKPRWKHIQELWAPFAVEPIAA